MSGPQRLCVGCRERVAQSDLVRVVAVSGTCVLDAQRRLPGRGANLHPDPQCLERAERRKAFPRALRVSGPLDTAALRDAISALSSDRLGQPPETKNGPQGHERIRSDSRMKTQ